MKKSLISFAIILGLATSLFGLEWGGVIDNLTFAQTPNFKDVQFVQSNGIHLNLSSSLNKDKSLRFASEIMYKYELDAGSKRFTNILDLSLLKLSGNWNINGNTLALNVGRFNYSDKTGFVFGQNSDGLNINYTARKWSIGAYAGYTGLLNRFTTPMAVQPTEQKVEQLYDLSYGFIPLMIDFKLTNVGGNVIGVQGQYYVDVANKNDKAYGSLYVKGPIGNICSYYVAATLGTNKFTDVMLRANMNLQFAFKENLIASAGVNYASGNKALAPFTGITIKPIHPAVQGVDGIVPIITCTYAPADNLILSFVEQFVMTIPESFEFNGMDSSLSVVYNVLSDLQLSTSLGAYTDFKSKENNKFSVRLNAAFVF